MKIRLMTYLAGLALSSSAMAHEHRPRPEGREDVKLTDQQRAQMREVHLKFEDERIDLEAKERHARLVVRRLLFAKDADPKAVRQAARVAAEASAQVHVAGELERIEIALTVFKPEQREEALRPPHGPDEREER